MRQRIVLTEEVAAGVYLPKLCGSAQLGSYFDASPDAVKVSLEAMKIDLEPSVAIIQPVLIQNRRARIVTG